MLKELNYLRYKRDVSGTGGLFLTAIKKKTKISLWYTTHTVIHFSYKKKNKYKHTPLKDFMRRLIRIPKLKYLFKGKAYRVRHKEGALFLNFNKAHKTHLFYDKKTISFELKKNKYFRLRFFLKKNEFIMVNRWIVQVRKKNVFTHRGL